MRKTIFSNVNINTFYVMYIMLIRRATFYNAFVNKLAKGKQGELRKLILRNIGTARYLLQISIFYLQI